MKKYRYNINNLDCANCAREVEESLNEIKDISNAIVNFSTSKVSFESDKDYTLKEVNDLVKKIEPDAYLTEKEVSGNKEYNLVVFILGIIISIIGIHLNIIYITIIGYILLLYRPFINAIKMLIKSRSINENLLIVVSCVGALIVKEPFDGAMVISLYTIGKILEEKAINNSRNSIKDLINIKQDFANRKDDKEITIIDVDDIKINDILVVKKGEKIPVDGIITKGDTSLDTSALTGESDPIKVTINEKVLSGSINLGNVIEIKVTNLYKDSTVAKILELVEDATDKKANTETEVSKISKIYTPVVLLLALLTAVLLPLLTDVSVKDSIYRGLTFLVISCPCAIAISVPLSYFTGIGVSSKKGILIKGSNYLDNLHKLNTIVFDKTGTLTTGSFNVKNIKIFDDKYSMDEVIEILVKGEHLSNHPIAKSIMKLTDKDVDSSKVKDYKEISGKGISYKYNGKDILIGSKKICDCNEDAVLHLNVNGKHIASITIDDGIKNDTKDMVEELKKMNIEAYMFTGDKKEVALEVASKIGIKNVKYEMLPTDKYKELEKLKKDKNIISFVGDGINDAPVLKLADIGISMGGVGSSSAVDASDIVIMKDDLSKIPLAISISKYTNNIIKQNLIFAISFKILVLILSIFGIANMALAVFADTGVTLLTILNTLRIIKKYR